MKKKQQKKKKTFSLSTVLLVVIFLVVLSLLLYPTVSDYWNSFHQSYVLQDYESAVQQLDEEDYEELLAAARKYNKHLKKQPFHLELSKEETTEYESLLNITGDGIMGYIEIPRINCTLPIYHGTDEGVLQIAIGHLAGTSLPVGGKGTHAVLSGHRGLPSARLFTDIDKMAAGDIFILRVLDETLTYQVDQIRIVLPEQTDDLRIDPKQDYCTLVTCTPYGINTHRLLVRGHRIKNPYGTGAGLSSSNAVRIEPILIAPIIAVLLLLLLTAAWMLKKRRKRQQPRKRRKK